MELIDGENIAERLIAETNFGSKARSLLFLKRHGFNVPNFAIVPWECIEAFLSPIQAEIQCLLESIDGNDDKNIYFISNEIDKLVSGVGLSSVVSSSLIRHCEKLFGEDFLVSVRSSSFEEDGTQHSFAGQLDTFLYVSSHFLIQSIQKCICSLYSARAIKYRFKHGLKVRDGMTVIIQKMVHADKSGVAFTMNISGNMNESVIVAGYGIGEGVVSGFTDTDMYYVERRKSTVISIINKKQQYKTKAEQTDGCRDMEVLEALKVTSVLTDQQVIEISKIGLKLEELYACTQDIEFAIDGNGKIFLVQSRPITGIAIDEVKVLDNSNIVESYPGVTLPLSFDFASLAYKGVFTEAARLFNLSDTFIDSHSVILSNLLSRVNSRVYYQLHNARKILEEVLVSSSSQIAWRNFIGLSGLDWPVIRPRLGNQISAGILFVKLLLTHNRTVNSMFSKFQYHHQEMAGFVDEIEGKSAQEIFLFFEAGLKNICIIWAPTIINDYFAMKGHSLYQKFIGALGLDEQENIANDLLCGIKGMESEQVLIDLLEMKDLVLASNKLLELFTKDAKYVWCYLKKMNTHSELQCPIWAELWQKMNSYICQFGDRTLEELKLETPTLRMYPWGLVNMLQNQLSSTSTLTLYKNRQQQIRFRAEKYVDTRLRFKPLQKMLFKILLGRLRKAIKCRENMRLNRARMYGFVKAMFLEIGKKMVGDHYLEKSEDVFYLNLDDLKQYSMSTLKDDYKTKIEKEKISVNACRTLELPDRIIFTGNCPDLSYYNRKSSIASNCLLKGIGVSKGLVEGLAVVIDKPSMDLKVEGGILVTRMTDPGWVFLISQSSGLVSEKGSLLSHTAIVGREFGIPTIVGVENITRLIKTGDRIRINGDLGIVEILTTN